MRYDDLKQIHAENGLPTPCPGCFRLWQKKIASRMDIMTLRGGAFDAMSRYIRGKICKRCEKMEGLMGYAGLSLQQAYPVVWTDWNEAMRLPPGLSWGATGFPSGGWSEWEAYMEKRNAVPFYTFDWEEGVFVESH